MGRIALLAADPALAAALVDVLGRDRQEFVAIGPAECVGDGGGIVVDPLREEEVAAAFAKVGRVDGLACVTVDKDGQGDGGLSWSRWTAVSRRIATAGLLALKHGGPLVVDGGAIVLTSAAGRRDPASDAARAILMGLARGASGGFALRGVRVNHVAAGPSVTDQAEAIAFLLTQKAGFVTGADIGRRGKAER